MRGISTRALALLEEYSWPGNVRELQNVIEGAFASVRDGLLEVDTLEEILDGRAGARAREISRRATRSEGHLPQGYSLTQEVDRYERELLRKALEQGGSLSETARRLGLSRQSLTYKLEKHGL